MNLKISVERGPTSEWTLAQLLGYLGTWSALKALRAATGADPMPAFQQALAALWGDPHQPRAVVWPLNFRVGRA